MKNLFECINKVINIDKYKLNRIIFELDESSYEFLSDDLKMLCENQQHIVEMSLQADRYKHKKHKNDNEHGNRTVWTSKDGDKLKMGDHARQRQDRPIEKGGDGEHIEEHEIIDMFIYTWKDIMEMYTEGELESFEYNGRTVNAWTTQCKCYLKGSEHNLHADGARPTDKNLWAVWLVEEGERYSVDITIKTIFRGERLNHVRPQERILIANNGFIKQIHPKY